MSSFLEPVDAVGVGDATIVPDATRPVAAVVTGDDVRWVTWPDAPLPDGAVDEVGALGTVVRGSSRARQLTEEAQNAIHAERLGRR
ncbi:hypothetical protein [Curtobacterium flaccumfaciens]|uniref:hypothetical protein n=1 Tax=Curtobacterium flaccumfaciens TaxID=2035 RepID=UPI00188BE4B6|nr:hypothetical protein [Curtobacterium flaccumfaciens]MBF4626531.1 hypothetical protein [Curtobacterium flaccumfaciens]